MTSLHSHVLAALGAALLICGCTPSGDRAHVGGRGAPPVPEAKPGPFAAVAILLPREGASDVFEGEVRFEETEEGVRARIAIDGLSPGSIHGVHVHEHGDCSAPDASTAGGHYAPDGHEHGLPPERPRHAGDMGNIVADVNGTAQHQSTFESLTLSSPDETIIGRSVIVHSHADDGTGNSGHAGRRIACGVIGMAAPI